jgi:hypothetical protein
MKRKPSYAPDSEGLIRMKEHFERRVFAVGGVS